MTPFLSFFAEHFVSFVVVIIFSKVLPKEIERNRISEKISGITSKFSLSFVRPDKNDTVLEMGTMPHRDSSDTFVLFKERKPWLIILKRKPAASSSTHCNQHRKMLRMMNWTKMMCGTVRVVPTCNESLIIIKCYIIITYRVGTGYHRFFCK